MTTAKSQKEEILKRLSAEVFSTLIEVNTSQRSLTHLNDGDENHHLSGPGGKQERFLLRGMIN